MHLCALNDNLYFVVVPIKRKMKFNTYAHFLSQEEHLMKIYAEIIYVICHNKVSMYSILIEVLQL